MTQRTNSESVATGLMMSLCDCCKACADDPALETFAARPVRCIYCGKMCTCEGCVAEVDPRRHRGDAAMSVDEKWADSMDHCTCLAPFLEGAGNHTTSCGCLPQNINHHLPKCGVVRGDGSYPGEQCIRPAGHEGPRYG